MRNDVSVIVSDSTIIVDGIALTFEFEAGENIRAVQWHDGEGHIEHHDGENILVTSYEDEVQPYVAFWEAEKARIDAEIAAQEAEYNKPENVRSRALSRVDAATSAAILAGFDYEIDAGEGKEVLHFSYDSFDQQNFSDTFNGVAMKKLMGVEELPETIEWNGWRGHNAESKGELVRLTLDVPTFLALYTGGALVHKAVQMEIGGQRKAALEAVETVEEIEALLAEWGL